MFVSCSGECNIVASILLENVDSPALLLTNEIFSQTLLFDYLINKATNYSNNCIRDISDH